MHRPLLERAVEIAVRYLDDVATRHVGGTSTRAELMTALGGPLPEGPADPLAVIDELAERADAGIVASAGPRYFGFVTGGAVPVTVAADWLGSAWDQNGSQYVMSPAIAVIEDVVAGWLLEMLGLPRQAGVGFVSGCQMANFTCLAAARHEVLRRAGWNVEADGLFNVRDGALLVPHFFMNEGAIGQQNGIIRLHFERLVRVMQRHLEVALVVGFFGLIGIIDRLAL